MKLLLLATFVGLAACGPFTHNGQEVRPIADYYRQFPDEYPLFSFGAESETDGGRIVGGELAELRQFPWQGALITTTPDGRFFCGCSLINPRTILTAAHCVPGAMSADVSLGLINRANPGSQAVQINNIPASQIKSHDNYNARTLLNDIALITLSTSVESTEFVRPVNLPKKSEASIDLTGASCTTSGFGRPSDGTTQVSNELRFVETTAVTNAQCRSTFGSVVTANNLCLSGSGGKGSCNGDSGGPAVTTISGRPGVQVGVVSFGAAAGCEKGYEHSYTRVTAFISWIETYSTVRFEN